MEKEEKGSDGDSLQQISDGFITINTFSMQNLKKVRRVSSDRTKETDAALASLLLDGIC